MRETAFIEQNREKWAAYEELLRQPTIDPDQLREMFIHITDDLAYARTFYPNRSVRYYLNGLAQRIFNQQQRYRRQPLKRVLAFWTDDLPHILWETRRTLWLSFGIFALSVAIGVVSSHIDPDFARRILGDEYVDMTLRNIEAGDPMAVYKDSPPLGMSVGIAANNLLVAMLTALSGVLTPVGTVFILIRNGIMLGVFQYFFIERDLFWPSFLTIWIHGTLEISAIIVAGAAGLVMGAGLLFPGTYTRRQAFQRSARQGLSIFLGLIPVFVLAAFFEGYLTRHTEAPAALRLGFILLSLTVAVGYFVVYPWWKARQGGFNVSNLRQPVPQRDEPVSLVALKNTTAVFIDAFRVLSRQASATTKTLLLTSGLAVGAYFAAEGLFGREDFSRLPTDSALVLEWASGLRPGGVWFVVAVGALLFLTLLAAGFKMLLRQTPNDLLATSGDRTELFLLLQLLLFCGIMSWLTQQQSTWPFVLFSFLAVWGGYYQAWLHFGRKSWSQWAKLSSFKHLYRLFRLSLSGTALFLLLKWGTGAMVIDLIVSAFSWLVPAEPEFLEVYFAGVRVLLKSLTVHLIWLLMVIAGVLQYFTSVEMTEALHLREGIRTVGTSTRIRGLARE